MDDAALLAELDRAGLLGPALACLPERSRRLLELIYGLGGEEARPLPEVARTLDMWRVQARDGLRETMALLVEQEPVLRHCRDLDYRLPLYLVRVQPGPRRQPSLLA